MLETAHKKNMILYKQIHCIYYQSFQCNNFHGACYRSK